MKKLFFILIFGFTLDISVAQATECPTGNLALEIDLETACTANFSDERICLISPEEGENLNADLVCLRGKFQSYADVEEITNFVAAASDSSATPILDEVFQPALSEIREDGSFDFTLSLGGTGNFQVILQADFYVGEAVENPIQTVSLFRTVTRIGHPDFDLAGIRGSNSNDPNGSSPTGSTPTDDPYNRHFTISATLTDSFADLCLRPTEQSAAGTDLTFYVRNEVTDPAYGALKILKAETVLQSDGIVFPASGFCAGGLLLPRIPLGHGENRLTIDIENDSTPIGTGQRLTIDPITNDSRGPQLVTTYQTPAGPLPYDLEGKVLLAPAENLTIDVSIAGGEEVPDSNRSKDPATVDENNPCTTTTPVCIQFGNSLDEEGKPLFVAMNRVGTNHFQARIDSFRFPINTFTLKGRDTHNNETIETHSFSFGNVRPWIDANGNFDPAGAMIPRALSAYLPSSYVSEEMKGILQTTLNSNEFKQRMFPKLLLPQKIDESIVNQLRRNSDCPDLWSTELTRAIRLYNHSIGLIEIPEIRFLDNNRIQIKLILNDFSGDAEIFALNISSLDSEELLKALDPQEDSDGDGILNATDFPGELEEDPVLQKTAVVPLKINANKLALNLEIKLSAGNSEVLFDIDGIPGEKLVKGDGNFETPAGDPRMVRLDCNLSQARTLMNGQPIPLIENDFCDFLQNVNNTIPTDDGGSISCRNQNMDSQILVTLREMLNIQIPGQVLSALNDLETGPLSQLEMTLFDEKRPVDLFLQPSRAEIRSNRFGLYLSLPQLIVPAATPAGSTEAPSAESYINDVIDPALKGPWFGTLREVDSPTPIDPARSASFMRSEINLALAEEFLNSIMQSTNLLLYEQAKTKSDSLDLSISKLREIGLGARGYFPNQKVAEGASPCWNQDGIDIENDGLGPDDPDDLNNNWRCFPFALTVGEMLGNSVAGIPSEAPVVIRTKLNPTSPITLKLVSISANAVENQPDGNPPSITAEIEIGLRDAEMDLFEGEFNAEGKVEIKDTCSQDRFLLAHPDCDQGPLPLIRLKTNGKLTLRLTFLLGNPGMAILTGGVASRSEWTANDDDSSNQYGTTLDTVLDESKTYLKASMIENNTLVRDVTSQDQILNGITNTFELNFPKLLSRYLADDIRSIWIHLPLMAPSNLFCSLYPEIEEFCGNARMKKKKGESLIDTLWNQLDLGKFGIEGLETEQLLLDLATSPVPNFFAAPRYLKLGISACLQDEQGDCL